MLFTHQKITLIGYLMTFLNNITTKKNINFHKKNKMFNNISIEKAKLLQQKHEEVKQKLNKEIIIHTSGSISVKLSLLGNIKEISNGQSKDLVEIIPIINEAITKARQAFEIKQSEMLQNEVRNLI